MNVRESAGIFDDDYVPAKALLLYKYEGSCYCICWKAETAAASERRKETNISARWKMRFRPNGLPELSCVTLEDIQQTIFVYQHFPNAPHHFPQNSVPLFARNSTYIIDEVYDRDSWGLNYLDQERWDDGS